MLSRNFLLFFPSVLLTIRFWSGREDLICVKQLCESSSKLGVILLPTTVKKTSTGRFGTGISGQKNPKLAHIFLSHMFLFTFGCGMTALGLSVFSVVNNRG